MEGFEGQQMVRTLRENVNFSDKFGFLMRVLFRIHFNFVDLLKIKWKKNEIKKQCRAMIHRR